MTIVTFSIVAFLTLVISDTGGDQMPQAQCQKPHLCWWFTTQSYTTVPDIYPITGGFYPLDSGINLDLDLHLFTIPTVGPYMGEEAGKMYTRQP